MRLGWWLVAALCAGLGIYAIFNALSPLWTLLAGLGVGVASAAALRAGKERE